jgi:hypothetical protein
MIWPDDNPPVAPGKEFSVLARGEVVLRGQLDYETRDRYAFRVTASDGRQNATTRVQVLVLNVNDWDPRFKHAQYEFFVTATETGSSDGRAAGSLTGSPPPIGQVQVFDGDRGDRVELDLRGPDARAFVISPLGVITLTEPSQLEAAASTAHFIVTAEDSGMPPRHAAVPVVVHFSPEGMKQQCLQIKLFLSLFSFSSNFHPSNV